jgi:hypothetical protein
MQINKNTKNPNKLSNVYYFWTLTYIRLWHMYFLILLIALGGELGSPH